MPYQPIRRRPYGRTLRSRRLVTEMARRPARAFVEQLHITTRPMPRGGVRLLVWCPRCDRPVAHLYNTRDLGERWMCRYCWRLRYPSEYLGRCPEADPARIRALRAAARRARSPAVRQRRAARAAKAQALRDRREAWWQIKSLCRYLREAARMVR